MKGLLLRLAAGALSSFHRAKVALLVILPS
jgi:hypothetical protein